MLVRILSSKVKVEAFHSSWALTLTAIEAMQISVKIFFITLYFN
jgi:hypothetical protein